MDVDAVASNYFSDAVTRQLQAASVSTLALMTASVVLTLTLIAKHLASAKESQVS